MTGPRRAVILAAGRGVRMAPLTDVVPKPMAPFAGATLIARGISSLARHVDEIYITVGYKGAMLAKHVIEHDVSAVFNTEGKGNAWWLYNTLLRFLNSPIYVLTCDNIVELDFQSLEADYDALERPPCMVVPVQPVAGLDGDYIFHEEQRIVKLAREEKSNLYCSGIQLLNPGRLNDLTVPCDTFYQVWEQLISRGDLWCSRIYPKRWTAIDTIEQLKTAERESGRR